MARVLITGGAGFIGSHAADALLAAGYEVRLFDNLSPQVHGGNRQRPAYLADDAELVVGDVTDPLAIDQALRGTDMVLHLASAVGVGQSMYDIEPYVRTNELGTAVLLQALSKRPVERLVVASSMSIYGEGLYRNADQSMIACEERPIEQLGRGDWELRDAAGNPLDPIPTPETKQPSLSSIYALNKYAQERMCLIIGKAYSIPTVALRFFNAFRAPPGLVQSVYRRARDLCRAIAQWPVSPRLRGRPATARLRPCARRRPRLPHGAGIRACSGRL